MNKNILLLIGALGFSVLFYQNGFGINILLFSLTVTLLLLLTNFEKFKEVRTILLSLLYVGTSFVFFIHHTELVLITNLVVFFIFLGSLSEHNSSVYVKFLNGFFSTIATSFYNYFNKINDEEESKNDRKIDYLFLIKMVGIPLITIIIFIILYRTANPYFDDIISKVDLSFIDLQWIMFTALGFFLFANITVPSSIELITEADIRTGNSLQAASMKNQKLEDIFKEKQLGLVLISLLNLLIIFYLITDTIYLRNSNDFSAPELSKIVHEGVYALIASIIIAISIILYFFRGNMNFYEKNKALKIVALVWIGLNIILLLTTSYKNYLYSTQFGLTYKRIGVFVYLMLCLFGLITTGVKILGKYNFWFLLRSNTIIALVLLVFASLFNWDAMITNYNVNNAKIIDVAYLLQLHNNYEELEQYLNKKPNLISYGDKQRIKSKIDLHLSEIEHRKWQEFTYENIK